MVTASLGYFFEMCISVGTRQSSVLSLSMSLLAGRVSGLAITWPGFLATLWVRTLLLPTCFSWSVWDCSALSQTRTAMNRTRLDDYEVSGETLGMICCCPWPVSSLLGDWGQLMLLGGSRSVKLPESHMRCVFSFHKEGKFHVCQALFSFFIYI